MPLKTMPVPIRVCVWSYENRIAQYTLHITRTYNVRWKCNWNWNRTRYASTICILVVCHQVNKRKICLSSTKTTFFCCSLRSSHVHILYRHRDTYKYTYAYCNMEPQGRVHSHQPLYELVKKKRWIFNLIERNTSRPTFRPKTESKHKNVILTFVPYDCIKVPHNKTHPNYSNYFMKWETEHSCCSCCWESQTFGGLALNGAYCRKCKGGKWEWAVVTGGRFPLVCNESNLNSECSWRMTYIMLPHTFYCLWPLSSTL